MPSPEQDEQPELVTVTEISELTGRSRQLIHRLATSDPDFPPALLEPGSTRPKYPRAAIEEWWANRVANLRQGRRTDLEKRQTEEDD